MQVNIQPVVHVLPRDIFLIKVKCVNHVLSSVLSVPVMLRVNCVKVGGICQLGCVLDVGPNVRNVVSWLRIVRNVSLRLLSLMRLVFFVVEPVKLVVLLTLLNV